MNNLIPIKNFLGSKLWTFLNSYYAILFFFHNLYILLWYYILLCSLSITLGANLVILADKNGKRGYKKVIKFDPLIRMEGIKEDHSGAIDDSYTFW